MFHSAAVRLTAWYLALIMAISLIFSGLLYKVSANDLDHNLSRQIGYFNNFLGPGDFNNYTLLRQGQLQEDKTHLRANLILFNLAVLAIGGAASYWLARRTLEPIEEALEAQSRFAADASHELRTPLTAVQTENEVALRNPGLTKAEAIGVLKSNLEEVGKLKALADGLLKLASNHGQISHSEAVPVKEAVGRAVERLAKTAAHKKIKIVSRVGSQAVRGEPQSLSELFGIFIDNAIKYSPSGSTISVTAAKKHREVLVTFSDKGPGIAPEDLPKIFERFYQADSSRTKSSGGGYGLGLAIAQKLAAAHGGHIEVSSQPGKGSSFIVHLPSA